MTNFFSEQVTQKLMKPVGLFSSILGKYSDGMAWNTEKEQAKKILAEVYGYSDVYDVCPPEIDQDKMKRFLDTVFSYHEAPIEFRKPQNNNQ